MAPPPSSSHLRRLLLPHLHRHRLFSTATAPSPSASPPPLAAVPTTESVLYSLRSLSKNPSLALAFFRRSAESGHPLGSAAYNLMLRTLASRASAAQHFWPFLRDMEAAGHSVDQGTYLAALASFKRDNLTADYASLTERLAKARTDAQAAGNPVSAAADAIRGLEEDGSHEELEKRLEGVELLPLTETAVSKVLREVSDYPVKALAFFRWAGRQNGYKHESVAYNAMARVLGREESVREFWELIQEMKADGMHLDI
ncbi:hypothetical protein ACQ4PT_015988 [Festuca glaucescens]